MTEYSMHPVPRIFGYLCAAAAILGGIYLLYAGMRGATPSSQTVELVFGVALIPLGFLIYKASQKLTVTIDDRALVVETGFKSSEILLSEIDGYRRGEKDYFALVRKDGGKPLVIPKSIRKRGALLIWIEERYEDIDARERETETEAMLEDDRYGNTREERETALAKAKKIGTATTVAGLVLAFWPIVYPQPFPLVMYLALAGPWVGVYLTWSQKGLLRLSKTKKSPYPSAVYNMIGPIFGVMLVAFRYHLYGFPPIAWMELIGVTAVLFLVAISALRTALALEEKKNLAIGGIVLFTAMYSYSLLIFSNCYFDRSGGETFTVQVKDKRTSSGKTTTYYLEVTPWGKNAAGSEESVSRGFYNTVEPQDSVHIYLTQGKWGIPWYRFYFGMQRTR
jgi:hypothetical protein